MKQRLDVLQHKVIDMVKQIQNQSDIIDKLIGNNLKTSKK
jgi:hypothetical protein